MPEDLPGDVVGQGGKGVVRPPRPPEPGTPETRKGVANPPPRPGIQQAAPIVQPQYRPPPDPVMADRIMLASQRTKAAMVKMNEAALYHTPDTTFWNAAVKNDEVMTRVTQEVLGFFATQYGNEDLAAFLSAELLAPGQREATINTLKYLRGYATPPVTQQNIAELTQMSSQDTTELIQEYLANPAVAETWEPHQLEAAKGIADELIGSLQDLPDIGIKSDIQRAIGVGVSGDVRMALTEDEVRALEEGLAKFNLGDPSLGGALANLVDIEDGKAVVREGQVNLAGGTTAETREHDRGLYSLGIEQVRQLGAGVIVLDKEAAQADPARAYAIQVWLEQNYPEMQVQYGREGAVGQIINAISIPLDYASAPFGAGLAWLGEAGERVGISKEERAFSGASAQALEKALSGKPLDPTSVEGRTAIAGLELWLPDSTTRRQVTAWVATGEIPEERIPDVMRTIEHLRDHAQTDLGMQDFYDQVIQNTSPRHVGTGFAESVMEASDMLPGDPFYNLGFLASTVAGAVMFDPFFVGVPFLAGARVARLAPKLHADTFVKNVAKTITDSGLPISPGAAEKAARSILKGELSGDAIYPALTASWIKSAGYRMLAQFPEEFFLGRTTKRAASTLFHMKEMVGKDEMFSALARWFADHPHVGGDTRIAKMIAGATSEEDMLAALSRAMMGLDNPGIDLAGHLDELNNVTRRLDEGGGLPGARVSPGRSQRAGFDELVDFTGRKIGPDEYIVLYHGTDAATAERVLKEGFQSGKKVQGPPTVIEDEAVAQALGKKVGDTLGYEPGRGSGAGVYLSPDPKYVRSVFGDNVLEVRVRVRDLLTAPERRKTGRVTPSRSVQLDDAYVEVDIPAADVARYGAGPTGDELARLIDRREWLTDVVKGREFIRPMKFMLDSRQLRQIARAADATKVMNPYYRALSAVMDAASGLPGNVMGKYASIDHLWTDSGAGKVIALPHTSKYARTMHLPNGELIDNIVEDGFKHLSDIGKTLGLTDKRVNQIMADWATLEGKGASEGYNFLTSAWEKMVDESPILPQFAKDDLRQMWHTSTQERSAGWLTIGPTEFKPTLARDGIPKPAFEADMLSVWRTPSLQDMRSYLTVLQRTMRMWKKAGGVRKGAAMVHGGLTQSWAAINNFWRTSTLGFRLFGALPARIFNEQMLRIAAYDYASVVHHPIEWLATTRWGTRRIESLGADTAFLEHPGSALGVLMNNVERQAHAQHVLAGRQFVTVNEAGYAEAAAVRASRYHASHSTNAWLLKNLDDPAAAVAQMKKSQEGREMLDYFAEQRGLATTPESKAAWEPINAVNSQMEELRQFIGTGPGADKIRSLLRIGATEAQDGVGLAKTTLKGGRVRRSGTAELAHEMQRMIDTGEWVPGARALNPTAAAYLPLGREQGLGAAVDKVFEWAYTNPDLALSRGPLYRQIATRNYRNLLARGYKPATAKRLAQADAARGTADLMFTIGAKTSGEWFLKNINPFFPAFRELATTWLKRSPLRVGEGAGTGIGAWGLGVAAISRRASLWYNFFKDAGIVREDQNGNPFVPLPFFAPLVRRYTGTNADYRAMAPLDSLAGILPISFDMFQTGENGEPLPWATRLQGIVPTLGGPSAFMLGALNNAPGIRGGLDSVEDFVTLAGADASLGPVAVDRVLEAFNLPVPWMTGTTKDMHEAMKHWSVIDGMRLSYPDMVKEFGKPPSPADDPAGYKAWVEDWLVKGRRYSTGMYLMRATTGMTLPFAVQIQDEGKAQISAMWALLDALDRGEDGQFSSAIINATLAEFPDLEAYMTGKNLDTRLVDDPEETLDEFMEAAREGKVVPRTPEDYAIFSLLMNSYSVYRSKVDASFEGEGTIAEQVLDFDSKSTRDQLKREWEWFLDQTRMVDTFLPGQTQSAADMFEVYQQYQRARDGEGNVRLSLEEQTIMDISQLEDEIAKYFSRDPESSEDFYQLRDQVFKKLGYEPQSEFGKAQEWYFGEYQDTYYSQLDKLYNKLDNLEDEEKAPIYDQIRHLADKYNHPVTNAENPQWGEFPSPEEYTFLKLGEDAQQREVAGWADLPAEWLTAFQREMVYGLTGEENEAAGELADYVSHWDQRLRTAIIKNNLSYSSSEVIDARAELDRFYLQKAQKLGVADYWRKARDDLNYQTLGGALNLGERTQTWGQAVKYANELNGVTIEKEFTPGGGGQVDLAQRDKMLAAVTRWRKSDEEFNKIITQLQVWLGEEGQPLSDRDVVDKVFFGAWIG